MRRFPTLQAELAAATTEALERFRDESKKTTIRLVDMEASYLTVDFFRRLPQEMEKAGNPAQPTNPSNRGNSDQPTNPSNRAGINDDRYGEGHFRRIGSNVSSYIGMVSETLRVTIPKAVVYCQVREAKQSLLNFFYTQIGKKEVLSLSLSLTPTHARTHAHTMENSLLFLIHAIAISDLQMMWIKCLDYGKRILGLD